MKREIALEHVANRTRLAVIEDGRLCEILYDQSRRRELTGGIYVGRVQNILPGMNAAFVDIGANKNAYLAAGDIGIDTRGDAALSDALRSERIEKRVRPGQMLICQVVREPGGAKGPRISQNITLPGRKLVLLPTLRYAGVSRKITDETERARLHKIALELAENGAGAIVRTAGEGADAAELAAEYADLTEKWHRIETEAAASRTPRRIETETGFAEAAVRDFLTEDTDAMRTDDPDLFRELIEAAEKTVPALRDRISLVDFETPLFDLLRVDAQIEEALARRVNLKSGGTIVIDETEAMTVIDVNTAKFVGKTDLEETVFRLNCEAAEEIARQARLRDLGGIIIIDFIDMENPANREALTVFLRKQFARDRNRTTVLGMTELGLMQVTRKKLRRPLGRILARECPLCGGSGTVLSVEETAHQAVRELWRRRRRGDTTKYRIVAGEGVAACIREIGLDDENVRVQTARRNGYEIVPEDGKGETT